MQNGYIPRTVFSRVACIVAISLFAAAAYGPKACAEVSPFGSLPWTKFGNLPNTPNDWELGSQLHLMAVDLYQSAGTPVYSVQSGVPSFPLEKESSSSEWITTVQITSPDGPMSYYMHLDPSSIPEELKAKAASGLSVKQGTFLGRLILHGGHGSHLHFGMADCRRKVRLNPLKFLSYRDSESPVVDEIFAVAADPSAPSALTELSGAVELTATIRDTIDGMSGVFPPNRVELEIAPDLSVTAPAGATFRSVLFDMSEMPAARSSVDSGCRFLSYDGYNDALGNAIYRHGARYRRKPAAAGFAMALTARTDGLRELSTWLRPHPGPWKTDACDSAGRRIYPNGKYWVRVRAFDAAGNLGEAAQPFFVDNPGCAR